MNDPCPEVIYGDDRRKDINEMRADPAIQFDAGCVLVLVTVDDLIAVPEDISVMELRTDEFGAAMHLCSDVKFAQQVCVRHYAATGFLVAPNLVATTAGNIVGRDLNRLRFLGGFQMPLVGRGKVIVSTRNICRIAGFEWLDEEADAALVRIEGEIFPSSLPRLRYNGTTSYYTTVHMIGFPNKLPKKYAPGAKVLGILPDARYFESDLEAFEANEGSPVFNSENHYVEGMLVRRPEGVNDFEEDKTRSCYIYRVIDSPEPPTSKVLSAREFAPLVPGFELLVSGNSGLPMGIEGGSSLRGAPLVQQQYTRDDDQWFRIELVDGYYRIVVNHTGMVLEVKDPDVMGSPIVQCDRGPRPQQEFIIANVIPYPGQYKRIVPRLQKNFCLDVARGSREPGAAIIQWKQEGSGLNQFWREGAPIYNAGLRQVADISGDSTRTNAPVGTWPYLGGRNQIFWIKRDVDGVYVIESRNGTEDLWTETDSGTVIMRPFSQDYRPHQQWRLLPAGDGLCWIESPSGGRVQPRADGLLESAAPSDSDRQRWQLRLS